MIKLEKVKNHIVSLRFKISMKLTLMLAGRLPKEFAIY